MDLEMFLRSIDVINLVALVTNPNEKDNLLRTREGKPANIVRAYSPKRIRGDISGFEFKELPDTPEDQARLRRWIQEYVADDIPDFPGANAFHLSYPALYGNCKGNLSDFEYTVNFYQIQDQ